MRCGVGRRCSLDLAVLWLRCRQAAIALIRSLAWEPPYAMGVSALKRQNKKKKKYLFKKNPEKHKIKKNHPLETTNISEYFFLSIFFLYICVFMAPILGKFS